MHNEQYSILIVDDNAINRELMSLQLRRSGFQTTEAPDGFRALEILSTQVFDIVLLDIMMPGMNGIEVLEKIREQHSMLKLPVIMVTADDHEESIIDALDKGANDYLVKPLNMPVTAARVKTQIMTKQLASLKDEFVRFASHDLKKPLIVTQDIIETLQQEVKVGDSVSTDCIEMIELVRKTAVNMQDVVGNFLNTEQLDTGKVEFCSEPVQLNTLVHQSVQSNQSYAKKKGIVLQEVLGANIPVVEADLFRITQVLDNLIGNAMKFSHKNTVTTVRTYTDGEFVFTEISDAGPGLQSNDFKNLFVKYAKLSNTPTGNETSSGIGLSLSKQMIDLHEGYIGARNNDQQGSTFWFSLPIKARKYA